MTKSEHISTATAVVVLLALAASWAELPWAWTDETIVVALLVGMSWAHGARTPEDEVRERRRVWLLPAIALAVAAQWMFFAGPGERLRMGLLGVGLVSAAGALAWRRRVARK